MTPSRRPLRSIALKLLGVALAPAAAAALLLLANLSMIAAVRPDARWIEALAASSPRYQALGAAAQLVHADGEERAPRLAELEEAIRLEDARYTTLEEGDPDRGVPPPPDADLLARLRDQQVVWRDQMKPALERVVSSPSPEAAKRDLDLVRSSVRVLLASTHEALLTAQRVSDRKIEGARKVELGLSALALCITGLGVGFSRGLARRVRALSATADRIAAGELALEADAGGDDELASLAAAFNRMLATLAAAFGREKGSGARLEAALDAVSTAAGSLVSASKDILAHTTELISGARQQAEAVSETASAVGDVSLIASQTAERAREVSEGARRFEQIGNEGDRAVRSAVQVMADAKARGDALAAGVLALADHTQAIGEIIATVDDIAEQTNLLALNAAIEASRAGEHGKGFAVVAGEVKALADQSKKATVEVRRILGAIQKTANRAVLSAEEGSRSMSAAMKAANEAGETIERLTGVLDQVAEAVSRIAGSAIQQAGGIAQIEGAIKNINQVTVRTLSATKGTQAVCDEIAALGDQLGTLLAHHGEEEEAAR